MSVSGPDTRERILAALFEALEEGRALSLRDLEARFPGRAGLASELLADVQAYTQLRDGLRPPSAERVDLAPGARLGDFEIVAPLARGGMGHVFRAKQLSLGGRAVALKVTAVNAGGDARSDARAIERFRREALALADLHHPHLAEVHGFGVENSLAFFAMRLVEGPTLAEMLGRGAPARTREELRRRVELMRQVASALATVHARGLIHRDVKPANVVLETVEEGAERSRGERAVLVDFGLVQSFAARSNTLTRGSPGTPDYASPEQLLGLELDPRTDVFSLGATLHDLLTGRSSAERLQASAGMEPLDRSISAADRDLAAVIARAVDPERRWRYADAAELEAELTAWLAGRAVRARRSSIGRRAVHWVSRHPVVLVRAASVLVVVALIGLALTAVSRFVHAGREVSRSFRAGDVESLDAAYSELPGGLIDEIVVGDGDALAAARTLAAREPGNARADIADALERGARDEALYRAAIHVCTKGPGDDAFIDRFFLASLCERDVSVVPRLHLQAAILFGRVFYERPLELQGELATGAAFRNRALELLDATARSDEGRPFLVTALSGCGFPGDARTLAELALAPEATPEDQRLAFQCAERIVRRALTAAAADELDLDGLESCVRPFSKACFGRHDAPAPTWSYELRRALRALSVALAFARRARGEPIPPEEWLAGVGDLSEGLRSPVAHLFAARRDERFPDLIATGSFTDLTSTVGWAWGWACGAYAETALTLRARARCRELFGAESISDFDTGVERGELMLRGIDPDEVLNADTLLGSSPPPNCEQRVSWPGAVGTDQAWWGFSQGAFEFLGWPCDMEVSFGLQQPDHIELFSFGRSEIRWRVELPRDLGRDHLELEINHQLGGRCYYPSMGRADVEVRCNGALVRTLTLRGVTKCKDTISIPSSLLRGSPLDGSSARQELSLRVLESTITPLWVHAATLRVR